MKRCAWCFVTTLFCLGAAAENENARHKDAENVADSVDSVVLAHGSDENRSENGGRNERGKENEDFVRAYGAADDVVLNEGKGKGRSSVHQIYGNRFDSAAERIAGVYLNKKNIPGFKNYSEFIRSSWSRLYRESLSHIPSWTEKYLKKFCEKYDSLFYPFGGPDVSYAINFFPHAKRYILVGLEPLGNFDQIEKNLSNEEYYNSVRTAFSHYLRKGYFITSEMQTQLSNATIKGGLNLILLALKKLEFNILDVRNCSIDADGNIADSSPDNINCIKIVCEKNSERKEIFYVRANLSNENSKLSYLTNFVHKFKFSTFVKSASYALHDRNFTGIRSFILNETHCILQDDTGVPFNFFRQNWDVHIFGTYTKPTLQVFRSYKQNSLSEYYLNHQAEPISFPIGYGYTRRTPNLVFAVSLKKKVEEQLEKLKAQLEEKKCSCHKRLSK